MSNNNDMQEAFFIFCARRGGYTVTIYPIKRDEYTETIFAGSLGDCLKYISENIVKVATKPSQNIIDETIYGAAITNGPTSLAQSYRNLARELRDKAEKYPDSVNKQDWMIRANQYEDEARGA